MDDDIGESDRDSVLAAEYALGLLSPADRAAFAARLADEPGLAAMLAGWQARFASLDDEFEPVQPPAAGFARIEARLFEPAPARKAGWWDSLALWRGLAAGAFAVAVITTSLALMRPAPADPTVLATQLVAALRAQEGSGVEFVAFYDAASATVRLAPLSGAAVPQRDYELWLIAGSAAPVSMGVIPVARSAVPVSEPLRGELDAGATLAVSLEPEGGSPTGSPTGPIVALGPAIAI
ncbi:MAG: anti-sigma factor [Devosia sp.]